MIAHYSKILHETSLGWAMAGNVHWLWPVCATLHLIGMTLLVGCAGALDLRLLGLGRSLPVAPLQSLMPVAVAGFAINLATGLAFYAGTPDQYQSLAFGAKMTCVLLAGVNALLFSRTGLARQVRSIGAGQDAPVGAKLSALASLVLWVGVMFWGRMLPVYSNAF